MVVKVFRLFTVLLSFFILNGFISMRIHPQSVEPGDDELIRKQYMIYRIAPDPRGGEAFKLVYLIPASVDDFWRFKTDFSGSFLLSNRYIRKHRLIRETDRFTVTEGNYTNAPGKTFRWRTTLHHNLYRLVFRLMNPNECGHKFHYGTIQLEPYKGFTKVTHIAYFDFFGAYVWVNLPLSGGMSSFLKYTAEWEREVFLQLKHRYTSGSTK